MSQDEHSHIPHECYQERIQELAELCDNEYHMSVLPSATNKERAERGRKRILQAIEELKELQRKAVCIVCHAEINSQILLQEKGLKEIEQVWSL